jgi:hypothetical protein
MRMFLFIPPAVFYLTFDGLLEHIALAIDADAHRQVAIIRASHSSVAAHPPGPALRQATAGAFLFPPAS